MDEVQHFEGYCREDRDLIQCVISQLDLVQEIADAFQEETLESYDIVSEALLLMKSRFVRQYVTISELLEKSRVQEVEIQRLKSAGERMSKIALL
ncbi:hypothetical protein FNV43_RR16493 [Rhamnella rubrinervis]|uniref:Uncharacterized protein n=1 Tax=Rhamnella rubrinervis TaxID=2594499 RepID=A0A8K0GYV7_9ROSA|nr:hypothetical protein FNV43_RR16493 [Rhamnella rubrinervis]